MNNNVNNIEYKYKKSRFLGLQMLATIGFIIALLISYLLTYDKKCSLENKKGLFTEKEAQNLALFQTILVFFIASFIEIFISTNILKLLIKYF